MLALSETPAVSLIAGGMFALRNAKFIHAQGNALPTGHTILYTCPAGRRAYVASWSCFNQRASGNIGFATYMYLSSAYYKNVFSVAAQAPAGGSCSQGGGAVVGGCIMNEGDAFSINCTTNTNGSVSATIIEFDASTRLFAAKILALDGSGAGNVLYTCPAGFSAAILPLDLGIWDQGTSVGLGIEGNFVINNASAGTITLKGHLVPSGGSPVTATDGTSNQMLISTTVGTGVTQVWTGVRLFATLEAGDYINIFTDTTAAGQAIWANVMEVPSS